MLVNYLVKTSCLLKVLAKLQRDIKYSKDNSLSHINKQCNINAWLDDAAVARKMLAH